MFVLKSYLHCAATFGDICNPFCKALSSVVSLYSATAVDPKVLEIVLLSLFSAKLDLLIASFVFSRVVYKVLKSDFLIISLPGMRKDSIARNRAAQESSQVKATVGVEFQESHCCVDELCST
jgi:hypothetical protein